MGKVVAARLRGSGAPAWQRGQRSSYVEASHFSELTMDPGDLTQLILVSTVALVLGRVGLAFARMLERRTAAPSAETDDRLRTVEDECLALRREMAELQERQDFAERALLQDPARARPAPVEATPERPVTPH
jgi:hypothetical protein